MAALDTKLRRDAWRMRGQLGAIALVIACGVAAIVMMGTTARALGDGLAAHYERLRFADLFAHMKRAPRTLLASIRDLPGVAQAEGRIAARVILDAPGVLEPASGTLLSIPTDAPPSLCRLELRVGRLPDPDVRGEAVVNEAFATALGLRPGDAVDAILNGRRESLRIVGVALSAEFVYALPAGAFVPDDRRFGVFWMRERQLEASFDLVGAFDDLVVRLAPGANVRATIAAIDRLTAPYGGTGAYDRDQQPSHRAIRDELTQLRSMGTITPSIFLATSALLVNVVLARLVRTEREQIAVLKAFGYSGGRIGRHYLALAALVAVAGGALGVLGGAFLARWMTDLYAQYFRLPDVEARLHAPLVLGAFAGPAVCALLGALASTRAAMRLAPAEAMRPEAPPDYRATVLERLGVLRRLPPGARMVVRHLERRPGRAVTSCLGLGLAVGVLALGSYVDDAIRFLMDFQFAAAQRWDVAVGLAEPRHDRAVREIAALPGVLACEPTRSVPVRIRHRHHERREVLTGVASSPRLGRALRSDGRAVAVPPGGIVLSASLAEALETAPGDDVQVEVLAGDRPTLELRVHGIAQTFLGTAAYMEIDALRAALREGATADGALLLVDPRGAPALHAALKETPAIAATTVKRAALDAFAETLASNMLRMRLFNVLFACVLAVGVVHNGARIALAERERELATLRVLGLTRGEVAGIFVGELAVLVLAAVPIGIAIGWGLCAFATSMLATESQRIPLVVSASTLAFAVAVVLAAAIATAWDARLRIDGLDLLGTLKASS